MLKKVFVVIGVLLIVLAAACGSDKGASSNKDEKEATVVATKAAATEAASTSEAKPDGSSASSLEPLSFITGQMFGGQALSAESGVTEPADPQLTAALLTEADLPAGYNIVGGDIGYSMELPQGQMKMAMRMFTQGDPTLAEMGPMVMSAAMAMPPSVLGDFDGQLDQIDQMSTEDLQKQMGAATALGIEITEISVKRVDIGDGGVSMHMVMDMSGFAERLGGLGEEGLQGFPTGIAYDMYIFKHGEHVFMAMALWPAGQESPADAASLAEMMDSRA